MNHEQAEIARCRICDWSGDRPRHRDDRDFCPACGYRFGLSRADLVAMRFVGTMMSSVLQP